MENSKNKKFKRGFSLVDTINLEGLALSEDEKYDIRQYIKAILLKSKIVDVKPDKVQYNEPKADPDCPRCKTQQVNRNHSPQCKKYQESRLSPTIENGVKMWKNSILRSKDVDGYDIYGKTAGGYTHLETAKFEDKD